MREQTLANQGLGGSVALMILRLVLYGSTAFVLLVVWVVITSLLGGGDFTPIPREQWSLPFDQFRDKYLTAGVPVIMKAEEARTSTSYRDVVARLLQECGDVKVDMLSPTINSFLTMIDESWGKPVIEFGYSSMITLS